MSAGTFTPPGGRARVPHDPRADGPGDQDAAAQREQLLLTVIIPALLLTLFSAVDIVTVPVDEGAAGSPWTSSRPGSWRSP